MNPLAKMAIRGCGREPRVFALDEGAGDMKKSWTGCDEQSYASSHYRGTQDGGPEEITLGFLPACTQCRYLQSLQDACCKLSISSCFSTSPPCPKGCNDLPVLLPPGQISKRQGGSTSPNGGEFYTHICFKSWIFILSTEEERNFTHNVCPTNEVAICGTQVAAKNFWAFSQLWVCTVISFIN